ncbi:T9SS type A sorting domain-containing protein [Maribellus comscasis]|uniref:T9SS type A sorting domain-containing protein n=1 Tax=Maribellus comscasis TaxID=2681766 RepID=A0A6I6JN51_9BACT|nr:T9SS type A sorting domain-containing protein [Maribellus comscasis]QGY44386.1 T9SS type A sorting domain-containing protein [Maribellus comscasis]
MKKIFVSSFFVLLAFVLNAQVILDHTYNYSATVVQFETLGYKYYLMDVPNSQCRIYNLDHSLYKTIDCSVPSGCYLSDVKFLSEKLFDNDSGIELLYTYYKYYSGSAYYEYDSKIINDDGSQIVFIDGALYNYINKTGEDSYKLFSYCYDFSSFPEVVWTNIYSLPGTAVMNSVVFENSSKIFLDAFPNPASGTLKVNYNLPKDVSEGVLRLYDNSGRPVNHFTVDHFSDHLDLDVSQMGSGVYFYFIEAEGTKSPSQKLVVQ